MKLDLKVLAKLGVAIAPSDYVRVTPVARAATPLGMGFGKTRFASPIDAYKVLYIAETLATGLAETLVRDRFQGKARRVIPQYDADFWGVTAVSATRPLVLVDLRTTGLVQLGVSTEAVRGKAQAQGRKLSQAVFERTDADGFVYLSRLTGGQCICAFDRSVTALTAGAVHALTTEIGFIPALRTLNVSLRATP